MKRSRVILVSIVMILCLIGAGSAGRLSSSGGGISSSHAGGGSGFAVRSGGTGDSATAAVQYVDILTQDGEFDVTVTGTDHQTDDACTVDVDATEIRVTGELDDAGHPAGTGTVTAVGSLIASGDEAPGSLPWLVTVLSQITSQATFNLNGLGQEAKVTASAAGTATGSGIFGGANVATESKGTTSVELEGANTGGPAAGTATSAIMGSSNVEQANPNRITVTNDITSIMTLNGEAEGETYASGSGKGSASSPGGVTSGKTSVKGTVETSGEVEAGGTAVVASTIIAVQDHNGPANSLSSNANEQTSVTLVGVPLSSSEAEGSAMGRAESSGSDPDTSFENSVGSSASASAELEGAGTATFLALQQSETLLNNPAPVDGQYFLRNPGSTATPAGTQREDIDFIFNGVLAEQSRSQARGFITGTAVDFEAEGESVATGDASTDTAFQNHRSETRSDGTAMATGEATDFGVMASFNHVGAFNYMVGSTLASANGGAASTFDTNVMSISSIGGYHTETIPPAQQGSALAGNSATGKASVEATYDNGANDIADTESFASGSFTGSGGMEYGGSLVGLAISGDNANSPIILPVTSGEFALTSSWLTISEWTQQQDLLSMKSSGKASGKTGAEVDATWSAADRSMTGESSASGSLDLTAKSESSESYARGRVLGGTESYYDPGATDGYAVSGGMAYGLVNGVAPTDYPGGTETSSQTVNFKGVKANAEASFTEGVANPFTLESEAAIAGTGKDTVTTGDFTPDAPGWGAWASSRIFVDSEMRRDVTGAVGTERGDIIGYYQAFTRGNDDEPQKTLAQLSGVKISGEAAGEDREASLALAKTGSAKVDLNIGSDKAKITFPVIGAKFEDEPAGSEVETNTDYTFTAPTNTAYAWWSARTIANAANPAVITPPQP